MRSSTNCRKTFASFTIKKGQYKKYGGAVVIPRLARAPLGAAFRGVVRLNLALHPQEYRYVFILAHRRSGSSLLAHILITHPQFAGAGETYTEYKSRSDLPKLIPRTCQLLRRLQLNADYIVDKITMDHYLLSDEILLSDAVHKSIILIRAPSGSLKSLCSRYDIEERVALGVYVKRLESLAHYGGILGDRALLVEYDDLVDHTDDILAALSRFFGVDTPFTSNYLRHRGTGKMGDPSPNIFRGHVFRTPGHQIKIGAETMAEALEAFRKYRQKLLDAAVIPAFTKEIERFPLVNLAVAS
jgi:hypothetical protein